MYDGVLVIFLKIRKSPHLCSAEDDGTLSKKKDVVWSMMGPPLRRGDSLQRRVVRRELELCWRDKGGISSIYF